MAPEEVKQEAAKPAAEEQTNCIVCNKPLKRLTRYYRAGKFYCKKSCWKNSRKGKKEEEEK